MSVLLEGREREEHFPFRFRVIEKKGKDKGQLKKRQAPKSTHPPKRACIHPFTNLHTLA